MSKQIDLTKLSREEKLALFDELEEKSKRNKRKRSNYTPNEMQLKVHQSQKRIRLVTAGNGSGKSCLGVWEAYYTATGTNPHRENNIPVPNTGIILLDNPDKTSRWLDEFNRWFDTADWEMVKNGKPYINQINLPNGSSFKFMYHLQEPMAFESFESEYSILDEPCPKHCFTGIQRSLRRSPNPFTLIVGTPIAQPWLKRDLYDPAMNGERDDIEVFKFGIMVNAKNLGKGYIDNFSKDLTPQERAVRLDGNFAHLDGLALAEYFKRDVHCIERFDWPRNWPCVVAIDFHGAKLTTAMLLGANKLDELYIIKTLASGSPPSEFAEELKEWYKGYRLQDILCDSLGASPRTGGYENYSFIDVLKQKGIPVRSTTFKEKKNSVWVQNIRDLLRIRDTKLGKRPSIYVFDDLLQVINEFESVMWARNKLTGERYNYLDISNQDMLSCLKYALACPPMMNRIGKTFTRPKPGYASPSGEQKGKY